MLPFLLSLVPLAAIDGSSAARPAVLALLLGSKNKPVLCGVLYVAGTFAVYLALSLLFVLGLGQVFEKFASSAGGGVADRILNPESFDYLIAFVIGLALVAAGVYLMKPPREKKPDTKPAKGFTPRGAFILGVVSNAIVGPGILPSFAAWNQVMKSSFSAPTCAFILVVYNLMVVAPLIFLVVLRAVNPERADRVFAAIAKWFATWGRRIAAVLFLLLGLVMIADAIGFFFGSPLIPTGQDLAGGVASSVLN